MILNPFLARISEPSFAKKEQSYPIWTMQSSEPEGEPGSSCSPALCSSAVKCHHILLKWLLYFCLSRLKNERNKVAFGCKRKRTEFESHYGQESSSLIQLTLSDCQCSILTLDVAKGTKVSRAILLFLKFPCYFFYLNIITPPFPLIFSPSHPAAHTCSRNSCAKGMHT